MTVEATVPLVYVVELDRICEEVTEAVKDEFQFIILSDKKAGKERYNQLLSVSSIILFGM